MTESGGVRRGIERGEGLTYSSFTQLLYTSSNCIKEMYIRTVCKAV